MPRPLLPQPEKFWCRVSIKSPEDCWPWKGWANSKGYGQFFFAGKGIKAHRAAYILTFGDVGELYVLHKCDTPVCCNPNHLYAGTNQDNMNDRKERTPVNQNRKVDPVKAKELAKGGWSYKAIGEYFGVTKYAVSSSIQRHK